MSRPDITAISKAARLPFDPMQCPVQEVLEMLHRGWGHVDDLIDYVVHLEAQRDGVLATIADQDSDEYPSLELMCDLATCRELAMDGFRARSQANSFYCSLACLEADGEDPYLAHDTGMELDWEDEL